MASDAKPASPARADPPTADAKDADPEEAEAEEKEEPQPERKRGRRKKGEAEKAAPATPTLERPSRERKTVERYSELTPRAAPAKKSPAILQGSGTKLKDIPNVSFKLSKRKADENLQSLHTLIYGRKSNVHFLKRNISQFSGFVWIDNQEKHRARIKEKLDKFNKEKLLDFCEILDIHVSKATTKKEEVSAKLLEFLESPCITRDVVLTDEKKGKKRGRRPKASGQATAEGASEEKKRKRKRKQAVEAEKENDDAGPAGSEGASMGEEDDEDSEVKDHAGSDEEPDEPPAKKKSTDGKQAKKEAMSKAKEKEDASGKKAPTKPAKGVLKPDTEEDEPDVELESKKTGKRASKSSSKEIVVPVDKASKRVSKPRKVDGKEGQSNNSGALNSKARKKDGAKASNKNRGKGKDSTNAGSAPTTEELHAVVSDILKEVDFNTATLADILRQLGAHFKMDLMDRKSEVKRIIEEVINSMSDDEEGEEENAEDDAEDNAKEEN